MTKQELLAKVSKNSGVSTKDVQKVLHYFQISILEDIKNSAPAGVNLLDLGQLKISDRSARTGINPQTKEKIQIPAKQVPKLVTSKKFKGFIDGSLSLDDFKYYTE